jgi:ribosomal protein S18 acetylase RimI-like enzyme
LYLLRKDQKPAGFVAVEKSPKEEGTYYIEKVAVHPDRRHQGVGRELMDFAARRIRELGGKRISIALIDANTRLKDWYRDQGFVETSTKDFPRLPFRVCFMETILS